MQDTEHRILELMHKAESERRACFSAHKAETTSKQLAANACLHTTALPAGKAKVTFIILYKTMEDSKNSQDSEGGDVFEGCYKARFLCVQIRSQTLVSI